MKPIRGKGTLRLTTETGKGMWESHQITAFQVLGKEKALTGIPPTLVWVYLIIRMYCPWMVFSDAGLHHAHSSFFTNLHYSTYCSSVSRLLVTFGDNFLSSGCAGQGMRSRPSLTVYIIARIDLGIMRHHATSCDIVRQLSGVDSRRQGTNDFMRGMTSIPCKTDCSASSEKPVEWKKTHRQRIDRNHPL